MATQPSLGHAIGLQGTPNLYENIALEQQRYKRKKEDDKKKAEKELLDKYRGSLNVTGYDPIYNQKVSSAAAGVVDELNKAQAGKYLNTIESNPEFRKKMADFQILAGNAKLRSQAIAKAEAEASDVANMGKITPNKELFDALNAARTQGEVTPDLEKYFGEGGMGVDPNKFYSAIPAAPFDYLAKFDQTYVPISGKTKIERDTGDGFKTTGGTRFLEQENLALAKQVIDNPNSEIGVAALKRHGGDKDAATQELFQSLKLRYKPEYEESLQEKSGGGVPKEVVADALKTPTKVITTEASAGGKQVPNNSFVWGVISSDKQIKPLTPTAPVGSINLTTGKPLTKPITDPDATLGTPAVIAVFTDGPLKGEQVNENQVRFVQKIYPDLKIDGKDIMKWVPVSYMTAKTSEPVVDAATGKPVVDITESYDAEGNPIKKEVARIRDIQEKYAIPLESQRGAYKKQVANIDDYIDRAKELNKNPSAEVLKLYEVGGQSSGPKTGDTKKLTSGKEVIFDGVKWVAK